MQELPEQAVERLARVSRLLATQRTLPAQLETIVAIVKRIVPGCDGAGIMLLIDGVPTSGAVSDRLTVEIDLVQYDTGEGPCLSAITAGDVIRIDVMAADSRFPRVAPGAMAHDIHSSLSLPLIAEGAVVGALNLYSRRANAFGPESEEVVRPLADYAAEVIGSSPLYAYSVDMVEGLVEGMEERSIVSQATGILMSTERLNEAEALDRLRYLALSSGESVATVAGWLLRDRPTQGGSGPPEHDDGP